jgi:ATP-binding cassette subfamily B protein/ATP-binding cassette subfamily C protein/ATP-binding cassette subfamily B multidrug efflux pump
MSSTDAAAEPQVHPDLKRVAPAERRQALSLLWRAARPDRRQLVLATLFLALAGILEAAGPILGKHFIDRHLVPALASGSAPDWMAVGWLIGGMLACGWAATTIRYFQLVRLAGLAMRSVQRLRQWVYGHVLRLPMSFFDRAITGQLVSRITNDTEAVKQLYTQVLFEVLYGATVLLGVIIAMLWLDWRLLLVLLLLVPAAVAIVWGYQRLSAAAVTRSRELRSDINAQSAEGLAGMAVLQASGAQQRFSQRFADTNEAHYAARMGEIRANAWLLRPALDLVEILLIAAVIGAVGSGYVVGIEVGLLYAFIAYMQRVTEPMIQVTMQFSMLQQSLIAASRVNTLLAEDRGPAATASRAIDNGSLTLRDVSFGYDAREPVLHDIRLSFEAGGFYGIVGHTGSGKSTLLALLLRFYAPQSGRIEIGGVPLQDIGDDAFRRQVGLVPQEPFLLAASARENIDMGRGLDPTAIEAAARAARVHEVIERLEQGYDTPLGEGGARLSSGQKQLIALARALAGAPRILFLDEATSRIDSETEREVAAALDALRGQVTVIAIAHRLSTIRAADRIVVLNHGRIAEQGAHDALMARDGGIYQRLYLLQQIGD